jgi:hypothetical protein
LKTGVEVKTGFFPTAVILYLCSPTVVIDGKPQRVSWGSRFFELSPGHHTIKIFFGYLFWRECGANSIEVNVVEGQTSRVEYSAPWLMTMKGSIKELK